MLFRSPIGAFQNDTLTLCRSDTEFLFPCSSLYHIVNISTILDLEKPPYNLFITVQGGVISIIDYGPLWKTMQARQVTQYQLLKSGIDNKTLDALKKNKNITLLTLEKLCTILNCTPNDVVMFKE